MANYYTKFSFIVPLPTAEAVQQALAIDEKMDHICMERQRNDETIDWTGIPDELRDVEVMENWYFDVDDETDEDGPCVNIFTEEGGVDAACQFTQHLIRKFNPGIAVSFHWAGDCDKLMRITNSHESGIRAEHRHFPAFEHKAIFEHAVQVYGFLVPAGKSITGSEWVEIIRSTYTQSRRLQAVCDSILEAMS